jgi:hypothetical protein
MAKNRLPAFVMATSFLLSVNAQAGFKCQPAQNLKDFQANPKQFLDQAPPKLNPATCQQVQGVQFWSQQQIKDKAFVQAKDSQRDNFKMVYQDAAGLSHQVSLQNVPAGKAGIEGNDKAERLVDLGNNIYRTLEEMENDGLLEGSLPEMPWSDDYWAIARGVLGHRYSDQDFVDEKDATYNAGNQDGIWKALAEFVFEPIDVQNARRGDLSKYVYRADQSPFAKYDPATKGVDLSPAEKYDLLIGDKNFTLTKYSWEEGFHYFKEYGKVENWMGICHGWAPAAYMMPRPTKSIEVTAADGKVIKFRPSDLKSLGSMLWAKTQNATKFIGGRCNDKEAKKDPDTGRILSQDCFDNNPGSWHMSVVNQIGRSQRSVVMDATYDYEVWNHPIVSYSYKYFNPEKMEYANDIASATIKKADFNNDNFRKHREENRRHWRKVDRVVGVVMEVVYSVETHPTTKDDDKEAYDGTNSVQYIYDLELDKNGKIIGGEWYSNKHPDFLWTPPVGTKAMTGVESRNAGLFQSMAWDPATEKFPSDKDIVRGRSYGEVIVQYASESNQNGGQNSPLGQIVRELFNYAK